MKTSTKICPSCQSHRPKEMMVRLGFRKIRCAECNNTRLIQKVKVKQRLQQERLKGLL